MSINYKKIAWPADWPESCIQRLPDNAVIPFSEGNTDYQEYLKWLAEGNEPLPAD